MLAARVHVGRAGRRTGNLHPTRHNFLGDDPSKDNTGCVLGSTPVEHNAVSEIMRFDYVENESERWESAEVRNGLP